MRVVTQWWETKKVKVCGERFWRVGMDERVCMKRLLSRECGYAHMWASACVCACICNIDHLCKVE